MIQNPTKKGTRILWSQEAKQDQSDHLETLRSYHLGSIEPRTEEKDTIWSPNLKEILKCSCEVLKAMEWIKIPHTVAGSEVCSSMVEKKWYQARTRGKQSSRGKPKEIQTPKRTLAPFISVVSRKKYKRNMYVRSAKRQYWRKKSHAKEWSPRGSFKKSRDLQALHQIEGG